MKIVIDIPENVYRRLKAGDTNAGNTFHNTALESIGNGIVLPKGHGDLIDRDKLERDTEWDEYEDGFISYSPLQIFSEPVVIPADKGE